MPAHVLESWNMNQRIIVIDDDASILRDYQHILIPNRRRQERAEATAHLEKELFGEKREPAIEDSLTCELTLANQGEQGFQFIQSAKNEGRPFALAFVDDRMPPGWDGLTTCRRIREIDRDIQLVVVTAYSDRHQREFSRAIPPAHKLLYLRKPFDPSEIRQIAAAGIHQWELQREARNYQQSLEELIRMIRRLKVENAKSEGEMFSHLAEVVKAHSGAKSAMIATLNSNGEWELVQGNELEETDLQDLLSNLPEWNSSCENAPSTCAIPLDAERSTYLLLQDLKIDAAPHRRQLLEVLLETATDLVAAFRLKEQTFRNDRIATIGQMAAGIIHEISNPLTAVAGATRMIHYAINQAFQTIDEMVALLEQVPLSHDQAMLRQRIIQSSAISTLRTKVAGQGDILNEGLKQIHALMDNVRSMSSWNMKISPERQDITLALEGSLSLTQNLFHSGLQLVKRWDSPIMAYCDVASLKQVFVNLIINAEQAMEGRGKLTVSAQKSANCVEICFADEGPGIPESLQGRIFEPFYTTKKDGTGLGLSVVKSLIQSHGGEITCANRADRGAVFTIRLRLEAPPSSA